MFRGFAGRYLSSGGGMEPCRILVEKAGAEGNSVLIADKDQVLKVDLELQDEQTMNCREARIVSKLEVPELRERGIEIESMCRMWSGNPGVLCVDSVGDVRILRDTEFNEELDCSKRRKTALAQHISTSSGDIMEKGWCGITALPAKIAVVSEQMRTITIMDEVQRIAKFRTNCNPTSVVHLEESMQECFAVSEYRFISIWDPRMRVGVVERILSSKSRLNTIDCVGNMIVSAGQEKTLIYSDTRMLNRHWDTFELSSKYEVTRAQLSRNSESLKCAITSLDHEVIVVDLEGDSKKRTFANRCGFRGDSRWVGFETVYFNGQDFWFGACDTGNVFFSKF